MKYAPTVLPILRAQRELLTQHWGKADAIAEKGGNAVQIVTAIDVEVEKATRAELLRVFPSIEFVGEEGSGNRAAERFWLMDPIDGTQHYVRGLPFCTSMVALVEKNEVVFSVIYDFLNDRMYAAEKGQGAFCNEERISVSIGISMTAILVGKYDWIKIRTETCSNTYGRALT